MNGYPEYLCIDREPIPDEIRDLLSKLIECEAPDFVKQLLGRLAFMLSADRLALNLSITMQRMVHMRVRDILREGLTEEERLALLELDHRGCSERQRITARSLLNVKERWIMAKCTSGLFNRARMSQAHLDIEPETE